MTVRRTGNVPTLYTVGDFPADQVGPAEDAPMTATEMARTRMLSRAEAHGAAVEWDRNAPPVAEPVEGQPSGATGRSYSVARWAEKKGITGGDPSGNTGEAQRTRARVEKPPERLPDNTEINLTLDDRTITVNGKQGAKWTINLIEPALEDGALLTWTEVQIDKKARLVREAPDRDAAKAIGKELYDHQLDLLYIVLPDINSEENRGMIQKMGPSGFRQLADLGKRYVYELFTDADVIAQREAEYAEYERAAQAGDPPPNL